MVRKNVDKAISQTFPLHYVGVIFFGSKNNIRNFFKDGFPKLKSPAIKNWPLKIGNKYT